MAATGSFASICVSSSPAADKTIVNFKSKQHSLQSSLLPFNPKNYWGICEKEHILITYYISYSSQKPWDLFGLAPNLLAIKKKKLRSPLRHRGSTSQYPWPQTDHDLQLAEAEAMNVRTWGWSRPLDAKVNVYVLSIKSSAVWENARESFILTNLQNLSWPLQQKYFPLTSWPLALGTLQ